MTDLKNKALDGVFWSAIQKFGTLFFTFFTNLLLARLLSPEEIGIVGVLFIFISFSDTFLDSGFGSALIQKKDVTQKDYSSVFFFNLLLSVLIYIILFISSGYIADYFGKPEIELLLKIISLVVFFNAFSLVQTNQLIKNIDFKKLTKITTSFSVVSSIVAVVMAYYGFSYWSLVAKTLFSGFGVAFFLWYSSKWRPSLQISMQSLKELFSFGGFLFLSTIVEKIYLNFQSVIIGKYFSLNQLGYYSQAYRLQELPANTISQVINQVTFPLYSKVSDDLVKLKNIFRLNAQLLSYVVVPLFLLLFLVSEDLILFLYGQKWSESVQYFKYLCIFGMALPLNTMHTNIIKSLGKGKLYFNQQLIKRIIGILLISFSVQYGIKAIMISTIITGYIALLINAIITKDKLNYSYKEQVKDLLVSFLPNILPVIVLNLMYVSSFDYIVNLISNSFIYLILFILSSYLLKNSSFHYLLKLRK